MTDLVEPEHEVERHRNGPELLCRKFGERRLDAVAGHDAEPVALGDAEAVQSMRDARREAGKVLEGHAVAAKERIVERLIQEERRALPVQIRKPFRERRHAEPVRLPYEDPPLIAEARHRPVL